LDGIPLAIELAAARAKVLSVEQIAVRLDSSFELLAGGSRTALPRQQTLKATIDWSYNLLPERERTLFRRLSIFAGGFTLDAGETVCSDQDSPSGSGVQKEDVLDLLSHLVDKSLVVVLEAGHEGDARYRLLETLRNYARERLEECGEAEEIQRSHAAYYLALCEQAEQELVGPKQVDWLHLLDSEFDNVRAALECCRVHNAAGGLRLAASLNRFWDVRGYLSEGLNQINTLLTRTPDPLSVRAKALYTAGYLANRQGNNAMAAAFLEESLAICLEIDDRHGIAAALERLGITTALQGNYERGQALIEQSLELFRQLEEKAGLGWTLVSLGMLARTQDDYDRARVALEESFSILREIEDLHGMAYALNNLGQLARARGDYDRAEQLLEESLAICREVGHRPLICWALTCLGTLYRMRGDNDRARVFLKEALTAGQEIGVERHVSQSLWSLGALAVVQGAYEAGVRLIGAADGLHPTVRASLDADERADWDASLAGGRAALGEINFDEAWAEGHSMTREQAISFAETKNEI
jgi:tetratricopeptide (TPR) repeat protein